MGNISHLGNLQNTYSDLQRYAQQYQNSQNMPFVQQRTDAIVAEMKEYEHLQSELTKQQNLIVEEINLQQKNLNRYQLLYNDGQVAALEEVEKEKMNLLQLQRDLENNKYQQQQYNTQRAALQAQIVQQQTQNSEQQLALLSEWQTALDRCQAELAEWEKQYLLYAPIAGLVSLPADMQDEKPIKMGDELMSLLPIEANNNIMGLVQISAEQIGKIAPGQTAQIKLDAYPYTEYGMLQGTLSDIATLPRNDTYTATIALPQNLVSTYQKHLFFKQGMTGTASITTENKKLIEYLLANLRTLVGA